MQFLDEGPSNFNNLNYNNFLELKPQFIFGSASKNEATCYIVKTQSAF